MRPRAGILLPLAVLGGCVADGPGAGGPGPQPQNAVPSQLVVNMKDFVDTDNNGYLDTATATVYIFANGYAIPLKTAGSFDFYLADSRGKEVAAWHITPEQAEPCRIKTQVGPGYAFSIDLRRAGAEQTESDDTGVTGQFTDSRGNTIRSGRLLVTVGRVR